jgi:hypothetical protein
MMTKQENGAQMDYTILMVGTKIFYTGDMANLAAFGVIVEVKSNQFYSVFYRIKYEDGHENNCVLPASFEDAPGKRFWVRSEYNEDRRQKLIDFLDSIKVTDGQKQRSISEFDKNNS